MSMIEDSAVFMFHVIKRRISGTYDRQAVIILCRAVKNVLTAYPSLEGFVIHRDQGVLYTSEIFVFVLSQGQGCKAAKNHGYALLLC